MLVNIWATALHLTDTAFVEHDADEQPLDLVVSRALGALTKERQTWMVDEHAIDGGTTPALLRTGYEPMRDASESYLCIVTPGFADVLAGVPSPVRRAALDELCRRARAFNKRVIVTLLGIPPACPVGAEIEAANEDTVAIADDRDAVVADLRELTYRPWSASGSRPASLIEAGELLAAAVMQSHAEPDAWRALHDA